jgi:hypothetical protein
MVRVHMDGDSRARERIMEKERERVRERERERERERKKERERVSECERERPPLALQRADLPPAPTKLTRIV